MVSVDREPSGFRWIARLYGTIALTLMVAVALAPAWLGDRHAPPRPRMVADAVFGNWLRWDGWWYVNIASHGYTYRPHHMSAVAFFPVYPLLIRATGAVLPGGVPMAAIGLTIVCGLLAMVVFHRWCLTRMRPSAARAAVVSMALYPFAWFLFGAAYSDALFLLLALVAFVALEADRILLAGVVGLVATATRPTGITLAIGLIAVLADRRGWLGRGRRTRWTVRDGGVLLSVGGLAIWSLWLWQRFGNPLAFIETEGAPGWNQAPGPHTWLKLSYFRVLVRSPWPVEVALVLQTIACLAVIALAPAVARRFGRGYGIYVLSTAIIPALSTADFLGVGRYLLPAFPVFALGGTILEARRPTRIAINSISAIGLVAGASLFASGYLIS